MKMHLVQGLALLLMVGSLHGQSSQATSPARQNTPPVKNQQMPNMQMPEKPTPPQREKQQMPGMQMPPTAEPQQPAEKTGPAYTLEQLQQSAVEHNPTLKQA